MREAPNVYVLFSLLQHNGFIFCKETPRFTQLLATEIGRYIAQKVSNICQTQQILSKNFQFSYSIKQNSVSLCALDKRTILATSKI